MALDMNQRTSEVRTTKPKAGKLQMTVFDVYNKLCAASLLGQLLLIIFAAMLYVFFVLLYFAFRAVYEFFTGLPSVTATDIEGFLNLTSGNVSIIRR